MTDDVTLLRRYITDHSEAAFAELVRKHVDLVYSAALRRSAGDPHRARDIVQQVFVLLAQRASTLVRHPCLSGWLYTAARNAAINLQVADQRRKRRERVASMSSLQPDEADALEWADLRRVLDDAMDELPELDRISVVLRFFERRSFAEVGAVLNVSENTARMRTDRALDKLREQLSRRGVTSSAVALGTTLCARAVSAAPADLASVVVAAAGPVATAAQIGLGHTVLSAVGKPGVWAGLLATAAVIGIALQSAAPPRPEPRVVQNRALAMPEKTERAAAAKSEAAAVPLSAPEPAAAAPKEEAEPKPPKVAPEPASSRPALPAIMPPAADPRLALSGRLIPPRPDEILQTVAATYAWVSSFESSGTQRGGSATMPISIAFNLWFRRPSHFRMEWASSFMPHRRQPAYYVVWENEAGAFSYWDVHAAITPKRDLALALAGPTGVMLGSPAHIPALLTSKATAVKLTELRGALLSGEEEFEGVQCWRIEGTRGSFAYELWIGREDFLIRKIVSRQPSRGATEEVHRNIRINGLIADEIFEPKPVKD